MCFENWSCAYLVVRHEDLLLLLLLNSPPVRMHACVSWYVWFFWRHPLAEWVCIYTYLHDTYTQLHDIYMQTRANLYMHTWCDDEGASSSFTHVYMYTFSCMHVDIDTCKFVLSICSHKCFFSFHVYVWMCIRVCMNVYSCMYECCRVCMNVYSCMYGFVFVYVWMCIRVCMNVYSCMYECVFVYVWTSIRVCMN
jgi:hypothetical protein